MLPGQVKVSWILLSCAAGTCEAALGIDLKNEFDVFRKETKRTPSTASSQTGVRGFTFCNDAFNFFFKHSLVVRGTKRTRQRPSKTVDPGFELDETRWRQAMVRRVL